MNDTFTPENTSDAGAGSAPVDDIISEDGILDFLRSHDDTPSGEPEADASETTDTDETETETPEGESDELETASVGGTDTEEVRSPHIPRARFDQVNTKLRETEAQLQALEGVRGWQPVADLLASQGYAPEQVLSAFQAWAEQAQAQPATPAAGAAQAAEPATPAATDFDTWLAGKGLDPYELTTEQYELRQAQFEIEQSRAEASREIAALRSQREAIAQEREAEKAAAQAAQQAAKAAEQTAQWTAELEGVKAQFSQFKNQDLEQDLIRAWQDDPQSRSFAHHAEAMLARWNVAARNTLAAKAVKEHPAAKPPARPVTAGGATASTPPSFDPRYADEIEMERAVASFIQAANAAAR
jgi:hypothetical protein